MLFHYQIRHYFLYTAQTDMRKGIDSLAGIVRNELGKDPLAGDLFIFMNRRRSQLKMLHWQGDGFALYYKRLEKGTYELPVDEGGICLDLKADRLLYILQGVVLKSVQLRTRYQQQIV
jgi:transposase